MELPTRAEIFPHARRGRIQNLALELRLERFVHLSPDELDLLKDLAGRRRYAPGEDIITDGARTPTCEVIASGWAGRQRVLSDGRRQIINFALAGDFVGALIHPDFFAQTPTVAITAVETLDMTPLRDALAAPDPRFTGLRRACAILAAMDQALLLEHVIRLGRLTAYQRTGHLLLELHARMALAGLIAGWRFPMPLTQEVLADHLGLSIVHVNRTLQQLRRENMIELRVGWVTVLQPEALAIMSDFKLPAPTHV